MPLSATQKPANEPESITATSRLPLDQPSGSDEQDLLEALSLPSGSAEKYKKRWIEFDCQKGVHHGKWSTYQNGKRIRVTGGYIGGLDKVAASGSYGKARVREFVNTGHNCHYPERFTKDLANCGITGIEVKIEPSGGSVSGLSIGGRDDLAKRNDLHSA